MNGRLRAFLIELRASYWFLPTLMTIAAFFLALLTVYLDRIGWATWVNQVEWLHPSRPEGARSQLSVIASAMIAVASTVFAITIAAVAYASGNYGPRLLNNFMNDRGNQVSLAVFIATFVYNLMILRVVRGEGEAPTSAETAAADALPGFVPQLSMLVSTASVLIAVAVLVYFLHHIPASIRINTVLSGIGRHLIRDIQERFPEGEQGEDDIKPAPGRAVPAGGTGYIEIIDFGELDEIAERAVITIRLLARVGDFVHERQPLCEVIGGEVDEALEERIQACVALGSARTPAQDLEFLIDELVEIALRALSPGINDPFTAVTSLHWIGAAVAELTVRDLRHGPDREDYSRRRVLPPDDDFSHFVRRSFGGVRHSAATSPIAAQVFLEALANASSAACSGKRRQVLREHARLLMQQAEEDLSGPSLERVRCAFEECERRLGG